MKTTDKTVKFVVDVENNFVNKSNSLQSALHIVVFFI